MMKAQIQALSQQALPLITQIRRHLHQQPELSFQEEQTAAFISQQLKEWNITHETGIAGHGILARISGEKAGKGRIIALRADMDALPIQEETSFDFKSINDGVMHACGHDVHSASLLGALFILNQLRSQFSGTILGIFQPAEEVIPGGAKPMMDAGIFNTYKPDLIIGQHVLPEMPAGKVGFKAGQFMASSDEIYLTLKGKGGHAALPHLLNDPVTAAAYVIVNLQQVVSRKSPAFIPSVLSFGRIIANGANNVIPSEVQIAGTFRTLDETWRASAKKLIQEIAINTAQSMGVTCEVEIRHGYPSLVNDETATNQSIEYAKEFLGDQSIENIHVRMTAEDFAYFSQAYPSVFYRLGTGIPGNSDFFPLHSSRFEVDERSLETGMGMMAYLAIKHLEN